VEGETEDVRTARDLEYGELPELTRALRALGSSRRSGGTLQSQFFLPLLDARKRAAEARSAAACVRSFDAVELGRALDRAIERILAQWPDDRPSVRRALRAELQERVSVYHRALARLSERATGVLGADDASRLDAWRGWTVELAATFDAADRSWIALCSVVDSLPSKAKP
jgi:hypothetical protein